MKYIKYSVLIFTVIGCGVLLFSYPDKEEYAAIKKEIKRYRSRNNIDIYMGEGTAKIKNGDIQAARRQAEDLATDSLLRSIKVYVKSDFVSILNLNKKQIEEKIDYIINTRADSILKGRKIEYYDFYPNNKTVTVIVYLDKSDYDRLVLEEENKRISAINDYALNGEKNFKNRKYLNALSDFSKGYSLKREYFKDIPIKIRIKEDNEEKNLDAEMFFDSKIQEISYSINLVLPDEKFIYSASGRLLNKTPYVTAYFKNAPIENLPVKFECVRGRAELYSDKAKSAKDGRVEINISKIDPYYKETQIIAEPVLSEYASDYPFLKTNSLRITLHRNKTVVFKVKLNSSDYNGSNDIIKSAINSSGFDPILRNEQKEKDINSLLAKLSQENLDYYLLIKIDAQSEKLADYNLYRASSQSYIYLYSVIDMNMVVAEEGPGETGYGSSGQNALSDSADKTLKKASKILVEKLKNYYK